MIRLCDTVTNHHILIYPQRGEDLSRYLQRKDNLFMEGSLGKLKINKNQDDYMWRRARRLELEEAQEENCQ